MSWAKDQLAKIEEQGFYCSEVKYICKKSIGNSAIKEYISENVTYHFCDYWYNNSKEKILIHIEQVLK